MRNAACPREGVRSRVSTGIVSRRRRKGRVGGVVVGVEDCCVGREEALDCGDAAGGHSSSRDRAGKQ